MNGEFLQLLNVREYAAVTRQAPGSVYNKIASKRIEVPHVRIGSKVFFARTMSVNFLFAPARTREPPNRSTTMPGELREGTMNPPSHRASADAGHPCAIALRPGHGRDGRGELRIVHG